MELFDVSSHSASIIHTTPKKTVKLSATKDR